MTVGRPGGAHLSLPFDVQNGKVPEEEVWGDKGLGVYPSIRYSPEKDLVQEAAIALLAAELPIFVCGGGVVIAKAEQELEALATLLGAPVATTVSGQGSLAEDHPLCLGVVGSHGGTLPTRAALAQADLVGVVGCRASSAVTQR